MMSQLTCSEELPSEPVLLPKGLRQTQNEHDGIEEVSQDRKRVRFRLGAPNNPVEPSCSGEDVELKLYLKASFKRQSKLSEFYGKNSQAS
ncbi:unnamed protein product [Paramecium octaurelia]|uniref:Uncharacterized protein n=1 Tax=Paramecium octaurelia TaxID=43137 RepID=A0A8S1YPJ5_PAROT|nr:unnamed protein product [Paramecium octaurelia]